MDRVGMGSAGQAGKFTNAGRVRKLNICWQVEGAV